MTPSGSTIYKHSGMPYQVKDAPPQITSINVDFKAIDSTQNDPLLIIVEIYNFAMMKTLVD